MDDFMLNIHKTSWGRAMATTTSALSLILMLLLVVVSIRAREAPIPLHSSAPSPFSLPPHPHHHHHLLTTSYDFKQRTKLRICKAKCYAKNIIRLLDSWKLEVKAAKTRARWCIFNECKHLELPN
jgi:hypothetical protein